MCPGGYLSMKGRIENLQNNLQQVYLFNNVFYLVSIITKKGNKNHLE